MHRSSPFLSRLDSEPKTGRETQHAQTMSRRGLVVVGRARQRSLIFSRAISTSQSPRPRSELVAPPPKIPSRRDAIRVFNVTERRLSAESHQVPDDEWEIRVGKSQIYSLLFTVSNNLFS